MRNANILGANDIGKFFVIDLEKLDAVTLTYGIDFERVKNGNYGNLDDIKDIYIINETSHNIFYVQGIENEGKKYYTDQKESDSIRLDPRVVEGVTIPEGFHYVGGNKDNGLVISDVADDDLQNSQGGNQFVWVPVENPDEIYGQLENKENAGKLYNFTANGPKPLNWEEQNKKMVVDSNSNREPSTIADDDGEEGSLNIVKGILTNQQEYYGDEDSFKKTMQEDYTNMLTSIEEYKGFFIGRFETSLDSNGKAQSKINQAPATADNASANTWYGFYAKQKDFATSNNRVESSMIWGSQYDAMIKWILQKEEPEKVLNADEGNHGGTVVNTGTYNNGNDIINNIYDLDGNVREWTLENSGDATKNRVSRGGNFGDNGQRSRASRIEDSTKSTFPALGSRMVLCISRPHVGDFVDYALTAPTEEQLQKLNDDIAQYSGADDNEEKVSAGNTLSCRILEIDKKGNPTKLISADGVNTLKLSGADGYNNAVYLINEMCETLYSGNQGTTRSLKIEDLEDNYFSEEAIRARDDYNVSATKYGNTRYYKNVIYPNILSEEAKMGVGTKIIDGKNQIRNGGLGLSEQNKIYTNSSSTSIFLDENKGITVRQTLYRIFGDNIYYKNNRIKSILLQVPMQNRENGIKTYWLASRCIYTYSGSCMFDISSWKSSGSEGAAMFRSNGEISNSSKAVRPIITLNSGAKAKYDSAYNSTYNKWNLK